ncbi:MAG: TIGR03016 family PEP-CTERM system-associated outer membrane protein [Gammaproteobacteria bacterium]
MRTIAARAAASILLLGWLPAASADWQFTPGIGLSEIFIDNIELAPSGAEEEEYFTQAILAFSAAEESNRLRADIDYQMQNLFAVRDSDRNATFHQLDAVARGRVYGDSLFIDANATYDQQLIDPDRATNVNNLFENSNLTDVGTLVVSPNYVRTVGRSELDLRYSKGLVEFDENQFDDQTLQDARIDELEASIGTEDEDARNSWRLRYDYQRTEFEMSPEFEFEEAAGEIAVGLTDYLSVVGIGGLESDLEEDTTSAGLDAEFWEAGFRLKGARNELELRYGRRFFGDSQFARYAYRGRRLGASMSYRESPTTAASLLAATPFQPTSNPVERDVDGGSELTDEVFVSKDFNAELTYKANRTEFGLNLFDYRSDFIEAMNSGETRGVAFEAVRAIAPRTSVGLGVSWRRNIAREGDDDQEDYGVSGGLFRQLGARTTGSIEIAHFRREPNTEYRANWIILQFTRRFGPGELQALQGGGSSIAGFRR